MLNKNIYIFILIHFLQMHQFFIWGHTYVEFEKTCIYKTKEKSIGNVKPCTIFSMSFYIKLRKNGIKNSNNNFDYCIVFP